MTGDRDVEMAPGEIDAFLARGGTGVLCLARGDVPYATPVSYGYEPGTTQFFFRLGFGHDAERNDFVRDAARARLVTYGPIEDGWTSVIATGTLTSVDDEDLTVETARALREAELPLLDAWGDDLDGVEFRIYRLDVDESTGRTTVTD